MNQIKIQGMHCTACKTLITMELEENKLDKYISNIELEDNNMGVLNIENADDEIMTQIKTVINNMPDYQVVAD